MTVSDIVLTNPTAEMTAEITTIAIITAVVVDRIWWACLSCSAGDRSHEPTDCWRARSPEANVVTRVTPTTRPIVRPGGAQRVEHGVAAGHPGDRPRPEAAG